MGLCMSKSKVSEKTTLYVPYSNIYPYKTTKYDERPGDVSVEMVKSLEEEFKRRYLDYSRRDLRLRNIQDKIIKHSHINPDEVYTKTEKEALEAAIQFVDFAFNNCLCDRELNKNNQFKYTMKEKQEIYNAMRALTLKDYGISVGGY